MILQPIAQRFDHDLVLRKAYHLIGGSVVFLVVSALDPFLSLILGFVGFILLWLFGGGISFALLGVMALLFISGSKFITQGALVIFVVGDGMAALIGAKLGRTKWAWSKKKTLVGSAAFLLTAFPAMLIYLILQNSALPWDYLLAMAFIPSLVACAIEAWPPGFVRGRRADDNLFIILTGGATLYFVALFLGFTPLR